MTQSSLPNEVVYEDKEFLEGTLHGVNMLRKNKQFCDVVLQVGSFEVYAHRAVLACASPYLFDLFTSYKEGSQEYRHKLNGGFEKESFQRLVNYAYTGRLEVPENQVKSVYVAATRLKMTRAAQQCGLFLAEHLTPCNCLGIRALPSISCDVELVSKVDSFIQKEISEVVKQKELQSFPRIQIELLKKCESEMETVNEYNLSSLVVEWIKRRVEEDVPLEALTEKKHLLYLNSDNLLHDCNEIQNGDVIDSEIIQDYKKLSLRMQTPLNKSKKKITPAPPKPRQLLYSRSVSDTSLSSDSEELEWKMIACTTVGDKSKIAVTILAGCLVPISIIMRLNKPTDEKSETPPKIQTQDTFTILPPMSTARCSVGAADLNGQLLVCGGYDRGECLKSAQLYDPMTNAWQIFLPMLHSRGRFDMTVIGNKAFVVGGSDGLNELASMECYDTLQMKWIPAASMPMARSNAGVCSLDGKVYCIGGWNGQVGVKRCDVFDPDTGSWTQIASLNLGRYQAGVGELKGAIYAVGGCDSWNCLSSVEKYDPQTDSWSFVAPIHTGRRGCGVAAYNGKLYAVGGNDGVYSLCSIEVYDPETNTWSPGPNLTSCRANVGVAVVGSKLYAVGGFTGKVFLNTIEYLDPQSNEWTTFTSAPIMNGQGDSEQ